MLKGKAAPIVHRIDFGGIGLQRIARRRLGRRGGRGESLNGLGGGSGRNRAAVCEELGRGLSWCEPDGFAGAIGRNGMRRDRPGRHFLVNNSGMRKQWFAPVERNFPAGEMGRDYCAEPVRRQRSTPRRALGRAGNEGERAGAGNRSPPPARNSLTRFRRSKAPMSQSKPRDGRALPKTIA